MFISHSQHEIKWKPDTKKNKWKGTANILAPIFKGMGTTEMKTVDTNCYCESVLVNLQNNFPQASPVILMLGTHQFSLNLVRTA
jgi:hypothetical protein